jgi:MFS family permease
VTRTVEETTPPGEALGLRTATRATYAAFAASGFAFASWASRIPAVKTHLDLTASRLGLLLLAIAGGSVVALPISGAVVSRWGSRRTVAAMSVLLGVGLVVVAVGYTIGVPAVAVGLVLVGFGNGAWDVGMNVQGALVERLLGQSIMSRFHAGFSIGTVGGALVGAVAVATHVPVSAHMAVVGVVVALIVPWAVRPFVDDHDVPAEDEAPQDSHRARAAAAWREPRTLLVGLFVLAYAFGEGTGNDWISVAVIEGYHASATLGTLTFASFLAAMTAGRWVGPQLLDRYGRVGTTRGLAVSALAGLLLFVFGPAVPFAFAGALLWGLGVSLGFPLGMSAGADEPAFAAVRVSVIASVGYCAFLGGPPLVGFLGQQFGVRHALTAVVVLLAMATAIAGVVRPPASPRGEIPAGPDLGR